MASSLTRMRGELSVSEKLVQVPWGLVLAIVATASIGFAMLYSAAGGNWDPWASRQIMRFSVGIVLLVMVALIDIRVWFRIAYVFYAIALIPLIAVDFRGATALGAQRWLDLGFLQLQPSELMKIALVLALARYFHGLTYQQVGNPLRLIFPALLLLIPAGLVFKQPDLGSALILVMTSAAMFFLGGVRLWKFVLVLGGAAAAVPVALNFLRDYQKQRILTFLDPETDPLGAGYHIIQSKIALGSGGIWGKGFLAGTQSHLQFLPERQTDFIFTMLSEEFGMVGGLTLLSLYCIILLYGMWIALKIKTQFGRLVAMGIMTSFYVYAFINIAMVMGLLPVVGEPLPLISYGGTAMMSLLIGFGLLISAYIHRDILFGRSGATD